MWSGTKILSTIQKHGIHVGSSFYAYDMDLILHKVKKIQNIFTDWNLLYSMKANPNTEILHNIIKNDVGIDAASSNEVFIARKFDCSPTKIYYSAPGKSMNDLLQCIDQCIIIADSINEVIRLNNIAKDRKTQLKIGIRVNIPNEDIVGNAFEVMTGISSKFGISPDDFSTLKKMCNSGYVKIIGLHVYFGSQILDKKIITKNLIKIARFALEFNHIFCLEFVNFGGGFGVPQKDTESPLDIESIANNIELKHKISEIFQEGIRCNLELGRYIVAESGIFCASVEDIKESFGKKYVILSSGINGFFRPVFTKEYHKVRKCENTGEEKEKVTIVGNLCTPIDQYYEDYLMEKLAIGDWIWFENAGAYGLSMSMLDFISKEKPIEIIV